MVFKYFYNLSSDRRQSRVVRLEFVNDTKCQCRELDNIHHHSLAELNSRQSIINGRPANPPNDGSSLSSNQLNDQPLNSFSLNGNHLGGDNPINGDNEMGSFAPAVQHQNAMRSTDVHFNDRSTRFTIKDSYPANDQAARQPAIHRESSVRRPNQEDQFNVPSVQAADQPMDPYIKFEPWKDLKDLNNLNNLVLADDLSSVSTMERPSNAYWNNKKFNGKLTIQNLFDCKTAKHCPEPYTIIQTRNQAQNNLCYCGCKSRNVNCIKVMNGLRRLDNQQIQCVLSGQCLLPECLYTSDDYRFNKNTGHCPTREEVLGIY